MALLAFAAWWVVIELFGLAALPLVRRVFAWLPDRGTAFSKAAGLLLVAYLLWIGASTGLLVNDAGGITMAALAVAGFSTLTAGRGGFSSLPGRIRAWWNRERGQVLVAEALFLLAFAGWALVRAFAPDKILPAGGEKFMEIGFLNGVLNSLQFPPLDPWLSGYAISYYYFGYVMMGVMTRLVGSAPTVGFDLYDALLFALTAVTAWGVVSNMVQAAGGSSSSATGFGLLGALFVGGLGNLEGLLEGLYSARTLPEAFWTWIDIPDLLGSPQNGSFYPGHNWWWWHASRVLRDVDLFNKPIIFQPIDEFPFFSFLLGDNHPHKLALPFVLLSIGLALNVLLKYARPVFGPQVEWQDGWRSSLAAWVRAHRGEAGLFLFAALLLGGLAFLNTWDFPIYLALTVLAYALGRWIAPAESTPPGRTILARSAALGLGLGLASILLYGFFYLGFTSQAGGVLPVIFPPTRLPQYLVMFGPFVMMLAYFLLSILSARKGGFPLRQVLRAWVLIAALTTGAYLLALVAGAAVINLTPFKDNPVFQSWMDGLPLGVGLLRITAAKAANPWLFLLLSALLALALNSLLRREKNGPVSALAPATAFGLLLAFAGIGLTLIVEFFYLRDNFGVRMNTIFKFYFQGWVMMACSSAFGAWWVSRHAGRAARASFLALSTLLVAGALVYSMMGVTSRAAGFRGPANLDAAASFSGFYPGHWAAQPDDWAAVQWLAQNGRLPDGSPPVILEAGAGGYENAGRISAFTGFPTLLGWTNHEGQWRGSQKEINNRSPVIATIYTTSSANLALDLLRKWNVRYVILGETERQYINRTCQSEEAPCDPNRALPKFDQALELVFQQGGTKIYRVP